MENFASFLIPVVLVILVLRLMAAPLKLAVKLVINSLGGLTCLWLRNWISGFTGIVFPINAVTAAVAGFLGLPGIILLAVVQLVL